MARRLTHSVIDGAAPWPRQSQKPTGRPGIPRCGIVDKPWLWRCPFGARMTLPLTCSIRPVSDVMEGAAGLGTGRDETRRDEGLLARWLIR